MAMIVSSSLAAWTPVSRRSFGPKREIFNKFNIAAWRPPRLSNTLTILA
jgi:hypothetical protein